MLAQNPRPQAASATARPERSGGSRPQGQGKLPQGLYEAAAYRQADERDRDDDEVQDLPLLAIGDQAQHQP